MRNFVKLKTNRDFRRLYGRGKSFVTPLFVLYVAKGRKNALRLGITAGKKLGGAVERNRAKRVITAAFQMCQFGITPGYDFVIVARSRILRAKSTDAAQLLQEQLKAAQVWCFEDDR